jgi:hypothetical protein
MSLWQKPRNSEPNNNDIWRYRTVNNVKILQNMNDVPRFINGICRTWKIETYAGGNEFIRKFLDLMQNGYESYFDGFYYANENGDLCYIILAVRPYRDARSTEVLYTHHTLSKSPISSGDTREVAVEEHETKIWLIQRACDELRLSSQDMQQLIPKPDVSKYPLTDSENTSTGQEAKYTLQNDTPTSSVQELQSVVLDRKKISILDLKKIPGILPYNINSKSAEEFFNELLGRIENVKGSETYKYPCFDQNRRTIRLHITLHVIKGNRIEMIYGFENDH